MSEFMKRSLGIRKQQIAEEWQQLQNDVAHWNRIHPDEEQIVIQPITASEIEAAKAKAQERELYEKARRGEL